MGCDIHSYAERKNSAGKWDGLLITGQPFNWRSYGVFAFLAGVRNYSAVTPISEPRGIPADASDLVKSEYSDWTPDAHTASWLTMKELSEFDYDQPMEDRRVGRQLGPNLWSGGETCLPGEGQKTTYRKFLDIGFFKELQRLQNAGVERIVFWFDN